MEYASSEHEHAHRVLVERYQHRQMGRYHLGPVHTQVYRSGPVAWIVCLHLDDQNGAGAGKYAAQVSVSGARRTGEVSVVGEPRRDPRTGRRLKPTETHLDVANTLADKISTRLRERAEEAR